MCSLRSIVLVLFAATAVPMSAAQLRIKGDVTELESRKPMSGVLIRVYKNGEKQHFMDSGSSGGYSVLLDNNASYVVRFSKPGHVTKSFAVDTYGPVWENDDRIVGIEVEMTLFEKISDLDLSFFDLPLGIARFTPMTGVISWNSVYEARVEPEVARLMHEMALRREQLANVVATRSSERTGF